MKTYSKRIIALTLAFIMVLAIPFSTFAEENNSDKETLSESQESKTKAEEENKNPEEVKSDGPAQEATGQGEVSEANGPVEEEGQQFPQMPESPFRAPAGDTTQGDIDAARTKLTTAIGKADAYKLSKDYTNAPTEISKSAFKTALSNANNAVNDLYKETVGKTDVDKANQLAETLNTELSKIKAEINKAKDKAKELEDAKKDLKAKIDEAKSVEKTDKYKKARSLPKSYFDKKLIAAETVYKDTNATVEDVNSALKDLTNAINDLDGVVVLQKLVISSESVNSSGIVSGYVKAEGLPVNGATVTFYTNGGVAVASGTTGVNGYFSFDVGTEYYGYYDGYYGYYDGYYDGYYHGHKVYYNSTDGYYYYKDANHKVYLNNYYWNGHKHGRCGNSGYLLASLTDYETSEKAYVTGTCSGDYYYYPSYKYEYNYSDYRVYPTSVSRTTSYVKGYLPNEKGRTVSVYSNDYYYDGYYSDGYYDSYGNWNYYNYYNGYYNRYYRNSNYYLGSATVDSDGYFTIYFNRSVPTSESLYYYVDGYKDGRYATAPSVSQAEAGTMFIKGKAGSYASIRVEDANGTKIGTTTANGDGEFACYLDRKLSLGETIKVIASESSKYDSQTTYKVVDTSLSGQTYARVSYIKGYPDGTFKPSNNVTRAEAAQMFATLLNNGTSFGTSSVTKFTDANNKWYSPAVNYIAGKGLLSGYSDGTFKPDADITRAEFAQMISGYLKAGYAGSANFKDVKGHWASDAIDKVFGNKAVEGYPDGTFKPNKTLTRAEAVTVLNAVFNRYTTSSSLNNVSSANLKNYSDISSSHWAYYQILDASNAHVSQKVTSTSNEEVWK